MRNKPMIIVCLIAALTGGFLYSTLRSRESKKVVSSEVVDSFNRWRQEHGKLYASPSENDYRLSVYADQLNYVERKNAEYNQQALESGEILNGPMFAMNEFGDLTKEEFSIRYTGILPIEDEYMEQTIVDVSTSTDIPIVQSSLGAQTFFPTVRNQGSCGSCWAFSTIIEMERIASLKIGSNVELSQQELIDCVTASNGCKGGLMHESFKYIRQKGVHLASAYPYMGAQAKCNNNAPGTIGFQGLSESKSSSWSTKRSEIAAQKGVIPAVSLYAEGAFRYLSGSNVYDASKSGECWYPVTHAVAQVNYENGAAEILNSWGSRWGSSGYMKIKPCNDGRLWGILGKLAVPYDF